MDPETKRRLSEAFALSLSHNANTIKQAEAFLTEQRATPSFAVNVLQLLRPDSPAEVRQAAAVHFKNLVKAHWVSQGDDLGQNQFVIQDSDKDQIKQHLTSFMLTTPPLVRAQLSEALAVISSHDFPARWQGLLPELISKLKAPAPQDPEAVYGVMETANAVFKRYRNQFMTPKLNEELAYSQQFVVPLLDTLTALVAQILSPAMQEAGHLPELKRCVLTARLACRTFFSLNSPGLTQAFEDTLGQWMAQFHSLLTYNNPALAEKAADKQSCLDASKAAVCANINLFLEINDEEFGAFVETFVRDVWTQLVTVTLKSGQDNLAMAAIRFLTTVARGVHHALFQSEGVLREVCERIVLPNLGMTEDLLEVFEMNFVEYIRRDTEGSDFDTRRRAATELVKALTAKFPQEVTQLFSQYVLRELEGYSKDPTKAWQAKDCAIYLVVALTVQGKTSLQGATATNQLVNLLDFFNQHVAPELQSPAASAAESPGKAVLVADALKFVTTFRSHIPKATLLTLFDRLVDALAAPTNVVHSYAAICIERLLVSKEAGQPRFSAVDLQPFLDRLLQNLFGAFQMDDSRENEYVMRCVCRVIVFIGPEIAPVASTCLQYLAALLLKVCENPSHPGFNHWLFEGVAALIRFSAAKDLNRLGELEGQLFPAFNIVLQKDVQEFHPYVFQIFAQLIELRPIPLPEVYLAMFPPLLSPVFWERPANIAPLVRLLQAYLCKAGADLVTRGHLQGVLGVFQKLISSKAHDHEGFFILNSLLEYLKMDTYQQYLPTIWQLLFTRLQSSKTAKFARAFIIFLSFFITQQGAESVAKSVEGVQKGLFLLVMQSIWLPSMATVSGQHEEKLVAVATTKLLCECPVLQTADTAPLWGSLLQGLLEYIGQRVQGSAAEAASADDAGEAEEGLTGYTSSYARLGNAAKTDPDPVPGVQDVKGFLATSLAKFAQGRQGQLPGLLQTHLKPDCQMQLQEYCRSAGVTVA
ncbi:hypothetical protein WJX73_010520 [Symbiochloris irregularis]|uniref:Importin N-terminal domain-containing protein n=1 Tax=Symbiochloris irregularis TaxID=706552 RepID=A0AAW1NXZ5_9CHLO